MPTRLLICAALISAFALASCGGSGGDDGIDTGLGFSVAVDDSAAPRAQVKEYADGIFARVQLTPTLQNCAKANAEKAAPAELAKVTAASGDDQVAASQKFQASFFKGCSLDAGKIIPEHANDETKKLVAFTLRDELKATLSSQGGAYATCVSKSLDDLSDDDLLALVQDPDRAQELGSKIAKDCGAPAAGG